MQSDSGDLNQFNTEHMYRTAVEVANLAVVRYDIRTHEIMIADSEMAKYDRDVYHVLPVMRFGPEEAVEFVEESDREKLREMYRELDRGAPSVSCEYWFRQTPGQQPRCESVTFRTFYDGAGKPLYADGIAQNITFRKLMEERYRRQIRQVAETTPGTIAVFRLNITKNWCGDGQTIFPRLLALQAAGTVDGFFDAVIERFSDDTRRKIAREEFNRANLIRIFREGRTSLHIEFPYISSLGRMSYGEGIVNMMQNPQNGDVEAIAFTIDRTKDRESELILNHIVRTQFDYIALIFPQTHEVVFHTVNGNAEIIKAGTDNYEKFMEWFIHRYIKDENADTMRECLNLPAMIDEIDRTGNVIIYYEDHVPGEEENRFKQVTFRWGSSMKYEIVVTQCDITEAYREEQLRLREMEKTLEMAERANSAKTEFISRISHDIRTPMNAISGMTEFALEDIDDKKKLQDDLIKIKSSNAFLMSLINDILDISKIDSGMMEMHPEPYAYEDYISNIRNMFEPICEEKGVRFVAVSDSVEGTIRVDHIRLNQLALNLLSNAVRYTPRGGQVTFTSSSKIQPDGRMKCTMEVRDTGIGMSPEFVGRMFEPFTQDFENSGRATLEGGTGLGLSIVKRIVDLMGGTIRTTSEIGKGTDILVSFPADMADEKEIEAYRKERDAYSAREGRRLRGCALLAEDNKINAEIAIRLLTNLGLEIIWAANGRKAVECFENSRPGDFRIILMDIQMPVMNGYEATKAIRALKRPDAQTIPIIAMTADAFSEAIRKCGEAGMNGHIAKPLDVGKLKSTLERVLGERG